MIAMITMIVMFPVIAMIVLIVMIPMIALILLIAMIVDCPAQSSDFS